MRERCIFILILIYCKNMNDQVEFLKHIVDFFDDGDSLNSIALRSFTNG